MGLDKVTLLAVLQLPATPGSHAFVSDSTLANSTPHRINIEYALTGADSTPASIPIELEIPTLASSQLPIHEPLVELVRAADAHIHAMAFLPDDAAADAIVERLKRTKDAEKRQPLTRTKHT